MKKTVFTICSVLTVCAVIIMSCEKKEDPNTHKVYYNTQTGYGTGGNPNPNGVATSGGSATSTGTSTSGTSTSTTGTSCTNSLSGFTSVNTSGSSGNVVLINSSSPDTPIFIQFPGTSAPASGTYAIVTGSPTGNQCSFQDGSGIAAGGSVTVTAGSPNKVTFSGVVCGSNTYTGTGCY